MEIKCQLDATEVFIADLIACSTCCWSGVELRVMCPVCRMLQRPANRTHTPQSVSSVVCCLIEVSATN